MTDAPIQADTVKQKFKDLILTIEEADKKLAKGEVTDLSHLEAEIAAACTQAQALGEDPNGEIQQLMMELVAHLDRHGEKLTLFKQEVELREKAITGDK